MNPNTPFFLITVAIYMLLMAILIKTENFASFVIFRLCPAIFGIAAIILYVQR